jgi:hypothetical protein
MVASNKFGWHSGKLTAKEIAGTGTGSDGFLIKNPKNRAASALSGTKKVIEISIGGTPYYFEVYPTI